MDAATALHNLGGAAPYQDLLSHTTRWAIDQALRRGDIVRTRHGHYALPTQPRLRARELGGVVSHLSAVQQRGWPMLHKPDALHVKVPHHRKLRREGVAVHHGDITEREWGEGITSPVRTVLDCAATLPFPAALAVADSALRIRSFDVGLIEPEELEDAAAARRGRGGRRMRAVAEAADARAANPMESALRAHLIEAGITSFVPQYMIDEGEFFGYVDLADPERRVALEADGYAIHGKRANFARDLRRHDDLQAAGWTTRRFAWEHVMFKPEWVVSTVRKALEQASQNSTVAKRLTVRKPTRS